MHRNSNMSRKDDPVFNVKFVQLVEQQQCLWNSTLPSYSKKEEIQKAWQEVANESSDTVRNCRERWRTIRSSFLRSLKLSRTNTGRGKRKYYLSKYLQFLIPYTKTRLKGNINAINLRKANQLQQQEQQQQKQQQQQLPPMTRICNMPLPIVSSDDTKDSNYSDTGGNIAEDDVVVSLQEEQTQQQTQQTQQMQQMQQLPLPTRITAIKVEADAGAVDLRRCINSNAISQINGCQQNNSSSSGGVGVGANTELQRPRSSTAVDLTEFADWIKSKNDQHRHCFMPCSPDADQSFLNSLHPFLREMTGKQNRRFRQKVVALIDAILDNTD